MQNHNHAPKFHIPPQQIASTTIGLNIINRFNCPVQVSLLGGNQDPMRVSANALTKYSWDLTFEDFSGDKSKVTLEYKLVGAAAFSTKTVPLQAQTWQGFLNSLNGMLLGFFAQDGVNLVTSNDTYVFGSVSITQ
jgi:hypothetical protein